MKAWLKSSAHIRRILAAVFGICITALFVFWPFSPAPLHIRLHFDEITGDRCELYYTTDTADEYSGDRCIVSQIAEGKSVDFYLDASLAEHIRGLRIDWPHQEQLLCVKSVAISSAGVVQKEFNPCTFFSDIAFQNNIAAQSMVQIRNRAYIRTNAEDPYMILGETTVSQIQKYFSRYRLTRLAICLFFFGCFFFGRRKLFAVSEEDI